jgi:peptidoglycan hydrolase-like protein with peptidoglycan-binding domain
MGMLIVAQGDSGPKVVALQVLLNRKQRGGTPLKVDGVYGPKTDAAVTAYRDEVVRVAGPPQTADWSIWKSLLADTDLQIVDAVDVTDPEVAEADIPVIQSYGGVPIETGAMCNGVGQVIEDVSRRVRGNGKLVLLRFHGHGGPGIMGISHGTRAMWQRQGLHIDPMRERTVISPQTLAAMSNEFRRLQPLFADLGFAEMHGCRIAQNPAMMNTLVHLWQVPVTAGVGGQRGGRETFVFEGPTRTVYPGHQSLSGWARSRIP